jgi:hypothetical protein
VSLRVDVDDVVVVVADCGESFPSDGHSDGFAVTTVTVFT